MNNPKHLNDYVSVKTYEGKQEVYNIFRIEAEQMKEKTASEIKDFFIHYFRNKELDKNITRNVLDVSRVDYMDVSGLAAILVLNRLSNNNGKGYIWLTDCKEPVKRLIKIAQLENIFELKKASELQ